MQKDHRGMCCATRRAKHVAIGRRRRLAGAIVFQRREVHQLLRGSCTAPQEGNGNEAEQFGPHQVRPQAHYSAAARVFLDSGLSSRSRGMTSFAKTVMFATVS